MHNRKLKPVHVIIALIALINLAILYRYQYSRMPFSHILGRKSSQQTVTSAVSNTSSDTSSAQTSQDTEATGQEDPENEESPLSETAASEDGTDTAADSDSAEAAVVSEQTASDVTAAPAVSQTTAAESTDTASGTAPVTQSETNIIETNTEGSNTASEEIRPFIRVGSDLPYVPVNELKDIVRIYSDYQMIYAEDSQGTPITELVTETHEPIPGDDAHYRVVFSATDAYGETAELEIAAPITTPTAPVFELTTDHAWLSVGDTFRFYEYVRTVTDIDGSPLDEYIELDGAVDTSTPGDYHLTYRTRSRIDKSITEVPLTVTVQ